MNLKLSENSGLKPSTPNYTKPWGISYLPKPPSISTSTSKLKLLDYFRLTMKKGLNYPRNKWNSIYQELSRRQTLFTRAISIKLKVKLWIRMQITLFLNRLVYLHMSWIPALMSIFWGILHNRWYVIQTILIIIRIFYPKIQITTQTLDKWLKTIPSAWKYI